MKFPAACPEIPADDLAASASYYRDRLGFNVDWMDEALGLGQLSRGRSRLFISGSHFRANAPYGGRILLWINLDNRQEVDDLYAEWRDKGAKVWEPPAPKPWKLHEFFAEDADGNILRVFYDFGWEEKQEHSAEAAA